MDANFLEYVYTAITIISLFSGLYIANKRNLSFPKNVLFWMLFGIFFNLFSLSWIYSVYPFHGALGSHTQIAILASLHVLSSVVAGIWFGLVGAVFRATDNTPLGRLIFVPLSIVLSEILRALSLSLLYSGNNTNIDLHWQAGTIGNALSSTPLIEFSYLGGAFGLTYLLSYLLCLCLMWQKLRKGPLFILPVLAIYAYIHFFVPVNGPGKATTVSLIETDFNDENPQEHPQGKVFMDRHELVDEQVGKVLPYFPDIIVFPEDTRYLAYDGNGSNIRQSTREMLVVDGGLAKDGDDYFNSSFFYDTKDATVFGRGKAFLFPFGEYIPHVPLSLLSYFVTPEDLHKYLSRPVYSPGKNPSLYTFNGINVGTLICSEILSYDIIDDLATQKPDIVFHQSSLSSFHKSPLIEMQLISFTKVAAAQMRTPIFQATNNGVSLVVDGRGRIVSMQEAGLHSLVYRVDKDTIQPAR